VALDEWERPIAFLRLANEIEDHLDLAVEYVPVRVTLAMPVIAQCALALDRPALEAIAADVAASNAGGAVPRALRRSIEASTRLRPRSTRPRLWVQATGDTSLLRRTTRHVPFARRAVYEWRRISRSSG